jgi:hypothetical protein
MSQRANLVSLLAYRLPSVTSEQGRALLLPLHLLLLLLKHSTTFLDRPRCDDSSGPIQIMIGVVAFISTFVPPHVSGPHVFDVAAA